MAKRSSSRFVQWALYCAFAFATAICLAQPRHQPTPRHGDSLKRFLQSYVGASNTDEAKATQYVSPFVSLKDDGTQQVIVYLTSDGWCGSGGCTTLILGPEGLSYRVIAKITITRPPIRVLPTKSNGWHDIAVQVDGGGVVHAYEAELSFDGKTYPSNPSMPPARRLLEIVPGKVAVSATYEALPLYP